MAENAPIWKRRELVIPVGILAAIMLALIVGVVVIGSRDTHRDLDTEMITACKNSALSQLKSPSTAQFGPMNIRPLTAPGEYTHEITGSVDASNSFGAAIRSTVRCQARTTPEGRVQVVADVS